MGAIVLTCMNPRVPHGSREAGYQWTNFTRHPASRVKGRDLNSYKVTRVRMLLMYMYLRAKTTSLSHHEKRIHIVGVYPRVGVN